MKKLLKYFILLFLILIVPLLSVTAQNSKKIDSLQHELSLLSGNDIKEKADIYRILGWELRHYERDSALFFLEKAYNLADSIDYLKGKSFSLRFWSRILVDQGNNKASLEKLQEALGLQSPVKDSSELMKIHMTFGTYYDITSDYQKGLASYFKALELAEKLRDSVDIASAHMGIGNIYLILDNDSMALKHYSKSHALYLKHKPFYASWTANNMGNIYVNKKNYAKAMDMYENSIELKKKYNDLYGIAFTYGNIGDIYLEKEQFEKALQNYKLALEYKKKVNASLENIANTYLKLGQAYGGLQQFDKGLSYLDKALGIASDNGLDNVKKNILNAKAVHYARMNNYKKAYQFYIEYTEFKDQILDEKSQKHIAEIREKYQSEKKELKIHSLRKEKALKEQQLKREQAERKKDRLQKIAFAGGFGFALVLALVVWRSLQRRKKDNTIISKQKNKVEEKNREITDSINYAQRIQSAILPSSRVIQKALPHCFILYKPKDIVAGDFYWIDRPKEDKDTILFAAADCTGHGVPGAMVSVVCNNALNRAVREYGLSKPSDILEKVNVLVEEQFEKSEEEVKDGMDIALCSYNPQTRILQYAGANNPLWVIPSGTAFERDKPDPSLVREIKADKQPIGKFHRSSTFNNHEIKLDAGDVIYIFSDGYPDQFGGPKGKKLKNKNLKKLLLGIFTKPIREQSEILDRKFEEWKGDLEQLDDVCLIGMKVS